MARLESGVRGPSLRILVVYHTVYPDELGGIETRNWELASALQRRGHEVTLAAFCRPRRAGATGPAIRSLGLSQPLYDRGGRRALAPIARFALAAGRLDLRAFDVVDTPNIPYAHLVPLSRACTRAAVPLIVSWFELWAGYWHDYAGPLRGLFFRAIERSSIRVGTARLAVSRLTLDRLAARGCRDARLLPCGVDAERVARAASSAVPGPPLVFAGRLLEHKRLDLLIVAIARLPDVMPGRPLVLLFGSGPDERALRERAERAGVADRMIFRGHVERVESVWQGLGGARLAVQPSAREGFGLFPLEAMAAGLPVLYCRSPESAVGELVRDGIDGEACAPDPQALAAAIRRLLTDPARLGALGAAARVRAASYTWEAIAEQFEGFCGELLAARR